jgi:tRNA(Ile)-lysidine synthase
MAEDHGVLEVASVADIAAVTTAQRKLLPEGAPVVALVSGGADSVALLRLLADGALGELGPLRVLHVNHMLRGAESDEDARFVEALCEHLSIDCSVVAFDVAEHAREHALNLEDAGRRIRYRFAEEALDALCAQAGIQPREGRIATAHHRDDRVETFLMRAITGAGAAGLSSIPFQRGRIVRPLLECDRAAIREWLAGLGQEWREDATNADTARLRAYVRAEMIPVAERINPAFRETLARSIGILGDEDALLARMAADFARDFAETKPGRVMFARDLMCTLDRAMARRTARAALAEAFPEASRLESSHIEAIVDGLQVVEFSRDLGQGLRAESEYDRLVISRSGDELPAMTPSLLPLPGIADIGSAGRIIAEEVAPDDIAGDPCSVTILADGLGSLVVDSARAGDRMRPLGMNGSRKLSDMLIDAKIPRRERPLTPVVRDAERVVWLAGVRMSDEYRTGPDSARAMRLTWERE